MKLPSYDSWWWNLLALGVAGIVGSVAGVAVYGGIWGALEGFGAGVVLAIVAYIVAAFGWLWS